MGVRYLRVKINIDWNGRLGKRMPYTAGEVRCILITDCRKHGLAARLRQVTSAGVRPPKMENSIADKAERLADLDSTLHVVNFAQGQA